MKITTKRVSNNTTRLRTKCLEKTIGLQIQLDFKPNCRTSDGFRSKIAVSLFALYYIGYDFRKSSFTLNYTGEHTSDDVNHEHLNIKETLLPNDLGAC